MDALKQPATRSPDALADLNTLEWLDRNVLATRTVAARANLIQILKNRDVYFGAFLASKDEEELIQIGLRSYGFCLRDGQYTWPDRLTFDDFANAIVRVYDTNVPRTKAIIAAMRSVHARMVAAQAANQMIELPI
jgi:hypothetical protein